MGWVRSLAERLEPGDDAAFDADGTLWSSDVGEGLQEALVCEGVLPARVKAEYERLRARDFVRAYAFATQALAGLREAWLRERAREFFAGSFAGRIFPEMRSLLREISDRGARNWIASASNRWVVEAGAGALGVPPERVLAMAVEVAGGVLTDRLVEPSVSGEGKAEVLRRHLRDPPALVAGNSVNDLAMLRMAKKVALVVNADPGPDPRTGEDLLAEAAARGWVTRRCAQSIAGRSAGTGTSGKTR
jgi:HAD superfamily phosphoserine phosphatase-like hydrolase